MTVDSLTFASESIFSVRVTVEELLGRLDEAEIERAVVCPLKPRSYLLEEANETVAATVERYPTDSLGSPGSTRTSVTTRAASSIAP